ncbi:MAG: hypothetical protein CMH83_13565 [Nocardioides sp.]|nr:hypothetical protein [Nocardioides sp.]
MIIGFALVITLTIGVVVDVSAAFLHRQDLDSLADGAALAGADAGAEGREVYTGGLGAGDLQQSADAARAGVRDYLRQVGAYADHAGLRVDVAVRGDVVTVRVSSLAELPLAAPGVDADPRLSATGAAVIDPR